jgi:alpha-ketoglutarate-dependent taurine dioxygenase
MKIEEKLMSLRTNKLHPAFGLEVEGLDLSRPLPTGAADELDALLAEHGVLVFRRQLLEEKDLIDFAGKFGELESTIYKKGVSPYNPEVIYISNLKYPDGNNVGLLGDMEVDWHSDQTYRTRPATGSMLYGVEVPSSSGRTYWANQYLAYESLPEDVKQAIDGKLGVFSYARRLEVFYPKDQRNDKDLKSRAPETAVHPVVLQNPITKRKALYADPVTLVEIQGFSKADNDRILRVLAEHAVKAQLVYQHEWSRGDAVFWDNGCTLHKRDPIAAEHARFMKRMTIYLRPQRHCLPH